MIFVEPHLKPPILKAGRKLGASKKALAWTRDHLLNAGDWADHKDHVHVRFR